MKSNNSIAHHVIFGASASGSVQKALDQIGLRQDVVGLPDDLSFGPIKVLDGELRRAWNRKELGYEGEDADYGFSDEAIWAEAARSDRIAIVWVHRHCAREYSNFLEFIWRLKGAPIKIIDLTNVEFVFSNGRRAVSKTSGQFTSRQIIETQLVQSQVDLSCSDRDHYESMWRVLKEENAPLRVVTETGLTSAPINYFDNMLLAHTTADWLNCARLTSEVELSGLYAQTNSYFLWPRLLALVKSGLIECRGNLEDIHETFVRRVTGEQA